MASKSPPNTFMCVKYMLMCLPIFAYSLLIENTKSTDADLGVLATELKLCRTRSVATAHRLDAAL